MQKINFILTLCLVTLLNLLSADLRLSYIVMLSASDNHFISFFPIHKILTLVLFQWLGPPIQG